MADHFDKKLVDIREDFEKINKKSADVYGDIQAALELGKEVLEDKLKDARGDAVAARENLRLAGEKDKRHLSSQVLKAQMKMEAAIEDIKNARDKRKLERYIDTRLLYLADLYDTIDYLLVDAELTAIEIISAAREYGERFGEEETEEAPAAEEAAAEEEAGAEEAEA